MGRFEEALPEFARALEASPDYGWAFINRGATSWELGRHGEAMAQLDRGVELSPDHVLDGAPQRGRAQELILALRSLLVIIPSAEPRILALCRTVEERFAIHQ
ncbi:tetratricopeptide repeat protein [Streptomyces sp. 147326]|uniref:tetratricopeptide repeat protein n=1 Tax=Streptomyces sp. 147326 TaxID=3074379 RepID=UPI003857D91B